VFDFNGTLSNDEPLLLRVYTELFRRHLGWDLTPDDYFRRLAGRSDREIIETAVAEHAVGDATLVDTLFEERRDRYRELVAERSPIEPAAAALVGLLRAHAVPLAIVTGAQRVDVDLVLGRSDLATAFDVIVTEEDVRRGKPHPEGFELAAGRLGADPSAVLVFEDSVFGIRAAHGAGMSCIGVVGTKTRRELEREADAVVDELSPALFDGLLG
jgi:beta-phosphoglucomutase